MITQRCNALFFGAAFWLLSLSASAQTSFSGTYYIGGSNPDYPTITAAINDLKTVTSVVTGPVTFKIRPGVYSEKVNIPPINGTSPTNTLTIMSESGQTGDVIIRHPDMTNNSVTFSTGCNNITLDHLVIENLSLKGSAALLIDGNLSTNGRSTTVQNCVLRVDSESLMSASVGIRVTQGPFDLKILNNKIVGGAYNIYVEGATYVIPGINRAANLIKGNHMTEAYKGCILKFFDYDYHIQSNYIRIREGNVKRTFAEGIRTNNSRGIDVIANNFFAGGFKNCINGRVITGELSIQGFIRIVNNTVIYDGDTSGASYVCYVRGLRMAEVFNNIFINKAKGPVVYLYPAGAYDSLLYHSDRNVFYTEGPTFGEFNTIPCSNFNSWQSVSLKDLNSMFFNPNLVSDLDLHTLDIRLEGLALPDSNALDDYDTELRHLSTPDIGADEFTIPAVDLALREPRLSGFPDDPAKKEITVLLRNEGMQSLQGKTLDLSYSLDGGASWSAGQSVTINDMDQLFESQLVTFNQTIMLANGGKYNICIRNNTPVALDNDLQNDRICMEYCRVVEKITYQVGAMPSDFSSVQDAADFLNNLDCDLDYPVIFDIKPGIYNGAVRLGKVRGASAMNSITFRSATGNAADVRIVSNTDSTMGGATFLLNNANFVTLENLSIENTAVGAGFGTYANGILIRGNAENNLIRNCRVQMDSTIRFEDGNSSAIVDSSARMNRIIHNETSGGECGILVYGSMKPEQRNNVIMENTIRKAYMTGIMAHQAAFTMIDKNRISLRKDTTITQGIYLRNSIADMTIDGNRITNAGNFGILIESSQSVDKTIRVSNNMISGQFGSAIPGAGIRVDGTSKAEVVFNSVNCLPGGMVPAHAFESNTSQVWMLKNNIFRNESGGYAYYIDELVNILESDYNDLYRADNNSELCYLQGAKTMAGLNNEGFDLHSLSVEPQFNAADDLHLFNELLNGKGAPVADAIKDIDGEMRDTLLPDIGADEFNIGIDGAINVISLSDPDPEPGVAQTVSVQISNPGNSSIGNFPLSYQVGSGMPVTETFSGTILAGGNASYTFSTTWTPPQNGTFDICGKITVNNDINLLNDQTCASFTTDNLNGISQAAGQALRIFPNPAQHDLYIQLPDSETAAVALYDLTGRQLHTQVSGTGTVRIDLSGFSKGVYLLKVSGENLLNRSRIVKQ